jgi:hypothetical protein
MIERAAASNLRMRDCRATVLGASVKSGDRAGVAVEFRL